MDENLATINNINKIEDELKLLFKLEQKYRADNNQIRLNIIKLSIEDHQKKLKLAQNNHSHQLLFYLGHQNNSHYYICPICEALIIDPDEKQLKDKYTIEIVPYLTSPEKQVCVKQFVAYTRKIIQRYNSLFTQVTNEDIYNYLQKQITSNNLATKLKKFIC